MDVLDTIPQIGKLGDVTPDIGPPAKLKAPFTHIMGYFFGEDVSEILRIVEQDAAAMRNMRQEAAKRGVTPERLVFAPKVEHSQHLARHRLADLFLDTLPFNGHTAASDALWAGLPVVTCTGNTFAGRVATSLLNAVALPELVTSKLDAYENLAHALATNPAMLSDIKAKLQQNRTTHPLFDTDRYRRHIEQAYITMWERYQGKESPEGFSVPALVEPPHPRASR